MARADDVREPEKVVSIDAEYLSGERLPYQEDIAKVEDIDLEALTPGEDLNWLEDVELLEEEGTPAVFDRYSNSFLRIYFKIPMGREDEIARKVLMAHRDGWRQSILSEPLIAATASSVTDAEALQRELTRVRLDGYAVEDGEHIVGVRQLAAPVTAPGGEVLAAVAVTCDHDTAHAGARDALPAQVRDAARAASQALADGADRCPSHRGIVVRLLASYGLAPINARL